jgi:hypothetical protein
LDLLRLQARKNIDPLVDEDQESGKETIERGKDKNMKNLILAVHERESCRIRLEEFDLKVKEDFEKYKNAKKTSF